MPFTPMLLVEDVAASSLWLRGVLPLQSMHGGPQFEMLADNQGQVILWLHAVDTDHAHPQFQGMHLGALTGGSVLYLQVADLAAVYERAVAQGALILEPPHDNPLAWFREFTFQDPNGYRFALHTAFGSTQGE